MHYYSPATGEHIPTDEPAFWMSETQLAPPAYDASKSSAVFNGATWEIVFPTPPAAEVPQVVTMRQARLALLHAGLLEAVSQAIAALPSPEKEAAEIEWEYAQTVERHNGIVSELQAALSLTNEQLDTLFLDAAGLA